jgi:hypothetical protein
MELRSTRSAWARRLQRSDLVSPLESPPERMPLADEAGDGMSKPSRNRETKWRSIELENSRRPAMASQAHLSLKVHIGSARPMIADAGIEPK